MKRVTVALTVAVVVWVSGCSSDAGTSLQSRRRLPNGLRVPAGARLIGRPVPDLTSFITGTAPADAQYAWAAHLSIDGSARRVYSRIRKAAGRAGLSGLPAASTACDTAGHPGPTGGGTGSGGQLTTCGGSGGPGTVAGTLGPVLRVEVARCERCEPATGIGRITYEGPFGSGAGQRVKPLHGLHFQGSSDPRRWLRLPGTRVLRNGWYHACEQNQLVALTVKGRPAQVWRAALANSPPVVGAASTKSGGSEVWQAVTFGDSKTDHLTMDFGARPNPVLFIAHCEGD